MKVNISGRGVIPGLNSLAPVRGVELSEVEVRRIINYRQFSVYDATTGKFISQDNVGDLFKPVVKTVTPKPVEKKVEVPKVEEPKVEYAEPKIEVIETPIEEVTEEKVEEVVEDKPIQKFLDIEEITPVKEDAVDEKTIVEEEIFDEVEKEIESETKEEPEEKPYQKYYKKKKKR